MRSWCLALVSAVLLGPAGALQTPLGQFFPEVPPHQASPDAGDALFLTPYIRTGKLEQGRKMARVSGLQTDVSSFAGLLTVNSTHNSNMFFWFFPTKSGAADAPVVLWLQGGPGGSSLFGLFVENGPFSVDAAMQLHPRQYSWHNTHSVLYIDNPVGTGFSFTESDDGYANNEDDVARDLYAALDQFFTLFDSYRANDFYITGESYAGKYVPAISYKIHQENQSAKRKINLKGLAIGDGLCDPINQLDYGHFLYNVGLVSARVRDQLLELQNETADFIKNGQFKEASARFGEAMGVYEEITGLRFVYNYLLQSTPVEFSYYPTFVTSSATRAAIHVGTLAYNDGSDVAKHLEGDIMRTVRDKIAALLDADYSVLIYNGQMDVIIDYIGTEQMVRELPWKGRDQFVQSKRHVWYVGDEVAGYERHAGALTQVMVRNAGHILPFDQPKWAYDMISRFTSEKRFA
ncbi:venom serine carboxypeptidase-like [Amphibalanus amphitrite]|uniref:venom serine carboxypeptidase-like n=1 Tax=Amphibalanus amphitrite TaxID=1232801 RepID=UPI001C91321B|nr:venom serine carboxypeptidase-like [Amphibalanus amphitrite]